MVNQSISKIIGQILGIVFGVGVLLLLITSVGYAQTDTPTPTTTNTPIPTNTSIPADTATPTLITSVDWGVSDVEAHNFISTTIQGWGVLFALFLGIPMAIWIIKKFLRTY